MFSVASISTPGLAWFRRDPLPINPGMVAIIGERGSGKTALADLIAHAADSPLPLQEPQTFLTRAQEFLRGQPAHVTWSTSEEMQRALDAHPTEPPSVRYLTQQFVERLCSAENPTDELIEEINRVVFLAHDPATRMGAADFNELLAIKHGNADTRTRILSQRLDRYAEEVLVERTRRQQLPLQQKELEQLSARQESARKERAKIIRPGGLERSAYYGLLRTAIQERETLLQSLELERQALTQLGTAVAALQTRGFTDILADLKRQSPRVKLTEDEWAQFVPAFTGRPLDLLGSKRAAVAADLTTAKERTGAVVAQTTNAQDLAACSLADLKTALTTLGAEIGIDQRNSQRLEVLNKQDAQFEAKRRQLDEAIALAEKSSGRLKELVAERKQCYQEFFDVLIAHRDTLAELYAPLEQSLNSGSSTVRRLSLSVVRRVDVEAWSTRGEKLLDLRKTGKFKGRGSLAAAAEEHLSDVWRTGTAAEVGAAMAGFRDAYDAAIVEQSSVEPSSDEYQDWTLEVGRWLYSTDHIHVEYSIEFDGVAITQLSPGTRGIVLLLLYLALDVEDTRPLIIDQPEENLDPRSVFKDLVGLFKDVRFRRQVIIVTHNANLVVNTDVDQVIVAASARIGPATPPEFTYVSGGLEDAEIRASVCEILEGGEAAFRERAKRLRVEGYV